MGRLRIIEDRIVSPADRNAAIHRPTALEGYDGETLEFLWIHFKLLRCEGRGGFDWDTSPAGKAIA